MKTRPRSSSRRLDGVTRQFVWRFVLSLLLLSAQPLAAEIVVVDMIPSSLSGETAQDSEPNLAVDPNNVENLAGSAFTWEPLRGNSAPIFISTDGGDNWSCWPCIPIKQITSDITLRFGGQSGELYVSALQCDSGNCKPRRFICRTSDFAKRVEFETIADDQGEGFDQPYIAATSVNGTDRVFVGVNDFNAANGKTATIERSLDGTAPKPGGGYTSLRIESRDTFSEDDPEVRAAFSADGNTVYAAFNGLTYIDQLAPGPQLRKASVVVVRDDQGGGSSPAFGNLTDKDDHLAGFRVVKERQFKFDYMLGLDRLGGDLAIAVDPRNSQRVYIVYGDVDSNGAPVLHLRRSDTGGDQWTDDIRTIPNAKNPGLAVNAEGTVGFLYQQVVSSSSPAKKPTGQGGKAKRHGHKVENSGSWNTIFERTNDDFATLPDSRTLAVFLVSEINPANGQPALGDYLHLMAVGTNFYGVFSSSNVPDRSRFPCGIIFQRYVDDQKKVLLDEDHNAVASSIDPFFFRVTNDEVSGGTGHR